MATADSGPEAPPLTAGFTINLGTRRSPLALKQAEFVVNALQKAHPHIKLEVHAMATMGDKDKVTPLPALGKGLWTNELEAQLETGELDIIVHSLKDMPTTLPEGMILGCVTEREDPRDVVVFRAGHGGKYKALKDLPDGCVVGTSSVRRAAQLRRWYPGLKYRDVRGNIDTRLKKCDDESLGYDCIILAAAGLLRMDFGDRIAQYLESSTEGGGLLHAVGQGALGIEVRKGDDKVLGALKAVQDTETMIACFAERSVMRTLEGGCSVPIGVETKWVPGTEGRGQMLQLKATVVSLDGGDAIDAELTEDVPSFEAADEFGQKVAKILLEKGASRILEAINNTRSVTEGTAGAVKLTS